MGQPVALTGNPNSAEMESKPHNEQDWQARLVDLPWRHTSILYEEALQDWSQSIGHRPVSGLKVWTGPHRVLPASGWMSQHSVAKPPGPDQVPQAHPEMGRLGPGPVINKLFMPKTIYAG